MGKVAQSYKFETPHIVIALTLCVWPLIWILLLSSVSSKKPFDPVALCGTLVGCACGLWWFQGFKSVLNKKVTNSIFWIFFSGLLFVISYGMTHSDARATKILKAESAMIGILGTPLASGMGVSHLQFGEEEDPTKKLDGLWYYTKALTTGMVDIVGTLMSWTDSVEFERKLVSAFWGSDDFQSLDVIPISQVLDLSKEELLKIATVQQYLLYKYKNKCGETGLEDESNKLFAQLNKVVADLTMLQAALVDTATQCNVTAHVDAYVQKGEKKNEKLVE